MLCPIPLEDVDPVAVHAGDERRSRHGRPWVVANMIATVDGSAADAAGRSGGLGSAADRAVFRALRAVADVIVAGATTVVVEDYGPSRPAASIARDRRARGQQPAPRIAVVSTALGLDPGARLFREAPPDARPIVLTTEAADPDRRRALESVAEVRAVGTDRVDWHRALDALAELTGATVVLCEGGPLTVGQLIVDDLVDEMCVTVAPQLLAGPGPRIAHGPASTPTRPLVLDRVLCEDGFLFLRYLRDRTGS